MPDRSAVLAAVDAAYAARQRSDKKELASHFAPGATFRIVGRSELMGFDAGPIDAMAAIGGLIDLFRFHRMERLHVAIEGNVAVIHWRIEVSTADSKHEITELCDIWTFDDNLKVSSVVEFGDTGLIAHMAAAATA